MSFISHTRRTEEHLWQGWAPWPGTHGPPKCVYVHVCAGSGPTAMLCIGANETRAFDERRVSALLCVRESRLNHSSTAGCNSPATETAVIAAATVCAVLTLIYMHARTRTRTHTHTHTHDFLVCLRNVNYQSHAKMQLLTESKIVFQSTCRVPGLRSCLGDKVSFLTDLSG